MSLKRRNQHPSPFSKRVLKTTFESYTGKKNGGSKCYRAEKVNKYSWMHLSSHTRRNSFQSMRYNGLELGRKSFWPVMFLFLTDQKYFLLVDEV
jgi:hypothetical protein